MLHFKIFPIGGVSALEIQVAASLQMQQALLSYPSCLGVLHICFLRVPLLALFHLRLLLPSVHNSHRLWRPWQRGLPEELP